MQQPQYGWTGTVGEFVAASKEAWLNDLERHHLACMGSVAEASQITAWEKCHDILRQAMYHCMEQKSTIARWQLVFEYELPRERGRRPDVVVLDGNAIVVLEFKGFRDAMDAHLDQVAAYARDLQHYHAASHAHMVTPVLVLTLATTPSWEKDEVRVTGPSDLASVVLGADSQEGVSGIDPQAWLAADYAPLPSLVSAARQIFQHEPLPHIRRAHSAGIPETIAELVAIGKHAQSTNTLHLALVTGVPGAGKTLVGLQFVYENHFNDQGGGRTAVFLSGNGPLVSVLRHALKSGVFVQDVHGFLKQYGGNTTRRPEEHIWVYDEAQRAWDAEQVKKKRGHNASEPEDFLRIGERMNSWALMVGLIGEGQEIHLGEEAGLKQWNEAIRAMKQPWFVHCPAKVAGIFTAAAQVIPSDRLDLTQSLRTHLAEDVQTWVRQLLAGDLTEAASTAERVVAQGFDMYVTRALDTARTYAQERYERQLDKRYGLLASSKARNLERYGIRNGFQQTVGYAVGAWYNDEPSSAKSCCQLRTVASEFECQGLELDLPIVGWGDDFVWNGQAWASRPQPRSSARDPHTLRVNSYRVLLTRGRDGFVVFVPPDVASNPTFEALTSAGMRELQRI
jgi:hypothetical protein